MGNRISQLNLSVQFTFFRWSPSCFKILLLPVVLLLACPIVATGQLKYTPEHKDVKAAAKQGVEHLQDNLSAETGEAILAAIATIEYSKRYDNSVPKEHPTVVHALNKANAAMVNPATPLRNHHSMYAPCLAIILYCEVDDQRYAPEIQQLTGAMLARQNGDGSFGYFQQAGIGDTSQTQYAALAMWVAKAHGFAVPPNSAKKTLEWLCRSTSQEGSWYYQVRNLAPFGNNQEHNQSIHCSGLSTVYLLGDHLHLTANRRRNQKATALTGLDLPPSVSIYVAPKNGAVRQVGPVVNFDRGLLGSTKAAGNKWLDANWTVNSDRWNYYYLYSLERYAFFRETAEGVVRERPTWYDQGVKHLLAQQATGGNWPAGTLPHESGTVNSSLAVMFLVRASQVLVLEGGTSVATGHSTIPVDTKLIFSHRNGFQRQKFNGVEDVMTLLRDGDIEDLEFVLEALGSAVSEMSAKNDKSRIEQVAFLRGMMSHPDAGRRMIAIKLLASVQDIDNAPALIYALGDPEADVQLEAHNGLRLISRKFDSIELSRNPTSPEFVAVKKQWTEWYLGIKPGAELLD